MSVNNQPNTQPTHQISIESAFVTLDCCCFRMDIPVELVVIIHKYYRVEVTQTSIKVAATKWCSKDTHSEAMLEFGPIDDWDTSRIKNMSGLFQWQQSFNNDISRWDTSNVTSMKEMFQGTRRFNQPLNNWNVAKVRNMAGMFCGAGRFNQPLDSWNVSQVRNMDSMFNSAPCFNQPLND